MNRDKPWRPAEIQHQILYLSAFCIKPVTADGTVSMEASTGKPLAQRWAPNHSQKVSWPHQVLHVKASPRRVSPWLNVNDLLFTGLKGKSVSTQTSLWNGICTYTFLPNYTSAVIIYLRRRFVDVNDAAESPHKADIFLVLSEFYEYLNHMLWILFLEVFQYLSKVE